MSNKHPQFGSFDWQANYKKTSVVLKVKYAGIIHLGLSQDDDDRCEVDCIESIEYCGMDIKDVLYSMRVDDDIEEACLNHLRDNDYQPVIDEPAESFGRVDTVFDFAGTVARMFAPVR